MHTNPSGVFLQPHLSLWEQLPEESIVDNATILVVRRYEELMVNPLQVEDVEAPFNEVIYPKKFTHFAGQENCFGFHKFSFTRRNYLLCLTSSSY